MAKSEMIITVKFDDNLKEQVIKWIKDEIKELPWKSIDNEAYIKINDLLKIK